MMNLARAVLLAALLGTSAAAQTGGTPVETPPVPLSPEKQALVMQHVRLEKPPEAQIGGPVTVGMAVPESIELWSLPQDSVSEVPRPRATSSCSAARSSRLSTRKAARSFRSSRTDELGRVELPDRSAPVTRRPAAPEPGQQARRTSLCDPRGMNLQGYDGRLT